MKLKILGDMKRRGQILKVTFAIAIYLLIEIRKK